MNLAEKAISNKVISWMFAAILLIGGVISFTKLGQLEFPEFTIKSALVVTSYPGASPQQVEEEVTLQIEDAIQQLPYIDNITSINSAGMSQITVDIKTSYDRSELPQIWDELRRKVNDIQAMLPPGARAPVVIDDFGDVFGLFYAATGDGYSNDEITNYLDLLRREIVLIEGVKKVAITGEVREQVFIDISKERISALGISLQEIFRIIQNQNVVSNAGMMFDGERNIRLFSSGEYDQVSKLNDLIIQDDNGSIVYLGDVAVVKTDYEERPSHLYRFNGSPAVAIGISFTKGVNVVDVAQAVQDKITELDVSRPLGIELNTIYNQASVVKTSINDFLVSLAQAVGIVIGVLLVTMGVRSGFLMGTVLLLTILGTFIVMSIYDIQLQKISLGALIIALGMLVDNAIVVTEGMLIGTKKGHSTIETAKRVISHNLWPLLGATVIAVVAFAPIGLSPDDTGEFANSLFWVLMISLLLSWVTAITLTPFFFDVLFKNNEKGQPNGAEEDSIYSGKFYTGYISFLNLALRNRLKTCIIVGVALVAAIWGFGFVKNVFFPPSSTPLYFIDYWLPQGTDIRNTSEESQVLEQQILEIPEVESITTTIGQGATRFILTYEPEKAYSNYAQLIVRSTTLEEMDVAIAKTIEILREKHPHARYVVKNLNNGPAPNAKIEARFSGPDPEVLRSLASQAEDIIKADPFTDSIRHDWRERTILVKPQFLEAQAREAGIDRQALNDSLLVQYTGKEVGVFRRGSDLLPIVARANDNERFSPSSLVDTQVWSPKFRTYVPITQVVSSFETAWEDSLILRRDRKRSISVMAEPLQLSGETADGILQRIRKDIESIDLPNGYQLEWGGEYELSSDAKAGLFASLPFGLLIMFLITVFLFNTIKQPVIIWLTVPLSLIGVVGGLLVLDASFSFMALLGMLSLSGMLIKNGIVLVEQIKLEEEEGGAPYEALVSASVSRLRPVSMAALTTVLGMIPLLFDAFFYSMAVTIIFGLAFATVLTLIVLPVAYSIAYTIEIPTRKSS